MEHLDTPGLHAVGTVPGLCLRIAAPPSTARSWALRLLVNGKRRELGLGGYPDVSLAQAVASSRQRRLSELGAEGLPMAGRGASPATGPAAIRPVTFAQAAEAYMSMHTAGWKHPLHESQWRRSLELHAYPKIGELDVLGIGIAARPKHHKALSLAEMPLFITCLRDQDSMAARALEFAVLTAARSGEMRHATWPELDLASKVWTIPAERMKGDASIVFR